MWEKHDRSRLGVEVYNARLFVNAENILGIRQSRHDPMLRPSRALDSRWEVDAWAPTDEFILNAGIRLRFGTER